MEIFVYGGINAVVVARKTTHLVVFCGIFWIVLIKAITCLFCVHVVSCMDAFLSYGYITKCIMLLVRKY